VLEEFGAVRGSFNVGGEVHAGTVEALVLSAFPEKAVGDVVNDAVVGDVSGLALGTVEFSKLAECKNPH